ncbi:DUF1073 domain-containing protein [Pectobacterium aroidearum]|uniref:DUF1073 domain-containing protein n=1 Tax=Pectobacterium aroidearum TaxID=1201031 RepID=UPI00301A13F5
MADNKFGGKPRVRVTSDGLVNVMTGMGTGRDRRMFNRFQFGVMQDFTELESAYIENWIARAIIDNPVNDATREWREFASDKEATEIRVAEKKYSLQAVTQESFKWAGVYGGAGALMITDQPFEKPLDVKKIKKGSLKRLLVLDRMFINGQAFNVTNPIEANYMLPDFYVVNGGTQRIHYSHFVKAPGAPMPARLRMLNGGWDDSKLRRCMEDIKDAVSAKSGIAAMIQEANIDVINRKNLANDLSSGDMDETIANRYNIFGMMKSLYRIGLLDEEEKLDRKQLSFSGLGEVLNALMEWTSGSAGQPMTRLFGVQAKGLGDSGQGDMNNYYNNVRGEQESQYRPFLKRIDEVLIRSTLGTMPDGLEFEFSPLSQPTDTELSAQRLADAQADEIRLNQGVVLPSQVARKLMEQGVYGLNESDIANLESDEKAERDGDYEFQLAELARANGENANTPPSANPTSQAE